MFFLNDEDRLLNLLLRMHIAMIEHVWGKILDILLKQIIKDLH